MHFFKNNDLCFYHFIKKAENTGACFQVYLIINGHKRASVNSLYHYITISREHIVFMLIYKGKINNSELVTQKHVLISFGFEEKRIESTNCFDLICEKQELLPFSL